MKRSRTLLRGLLVATFAATLVLPAAPTAAAAPGPDLSGVIDRVRADLAEPPDLSGRSEVAGDGSVVFRAMRDANAAGIAATSAVTITCLFAVSDPHVALLPTNIQATTWVDCNFPLPVVVAGVALYRQGQNNSLSASVATGFATRSVEVSTFTPCQTSAYVAVGTATAFAPPGFSPPVAHIALVSNVVLIAATGTPAPPLTCVRPPQPTPTPPPTPPTPGPAPVISSLLCEYTGAQRYICGMNATGWTQIRWTYNGSQRPSWNDKTRPPAATCGGGIPIIKVYVSNSYGTTVRQTSFRCSGQPL